MGGERGAHRCSISAEDALELGVISLLSDSQRALLQQLDGREDSVQPGPGHSTALSADSGRNSRRQEFYPGIPGTDGFAGKAQKLSGSPP